MKNQSRTIRLRVQHALAIPALTMLFNSAYAEEKIQYEYEDIAVVGASAGEPVLAEFSVSKALDYVETGASAWTKKRNCISCHTNGSYLMLRPALSETLGKPSEEIREFYVKKLAQHEAKELKEISKGITPTKLAYLAAGLAEWDAHVSGTLSPETVRALSLMFSVQSEDGSISNTECWPPYESSAYHGATVAAMAAATAPGYLDSIGEEAQRGYQMLIEYLKNTEPPHDYGRLLLLWTSTRVDGLLDDAQKQEFVDMILGHQQTDGGWSIRTFAEPEAWGGGNRAEKLREEPDFEMPASDGHMTGLAIVVLRDAGVAADDARIQRGVEWIKRNQRESGRWWTRSLNNDKFHFITYSGTCFPLLALAKTDRLPPIASE